ncbi:MAG: hypothetical protein ACXVEF_27965 [Polyangiales bacterium]
MRTYAMLVATAGLGWTLLSSGESHAVAPVALVLELVDPEPVGVRVDVAIKGFCSPADVTIYEGILKPHAPVTVSSSATTFCVRRTLTPHLQAQWGAPLLVHRRVDGAPLPVRFHAEKNTPAIYVGSPLQLTLAGNERIGVRVSAGATAPCNATGNALLQSGVLEPKQPLSIETSATCVCVEQTYAPYVTLGWTTGEVHCRPLQCVGKDCRMDLAAPFTLALPSRAPVNVASKTP